MKCGGFSVLLLGFAMVTSFSASAIVVEVATDKPSYYPGEQIEILVTAPEPGRLYFYTSLQSLYTMDFFTPSPISLQVLTEATTPHTWRLHHIWDAYKPGLGTHSVSGIVVGYGQSTPVFFSVVAPPPPTGDFVIDFDTIPGTAASVGHLMAYDFCGVRFHTVEGRSCRWGPEGDSWIEGFDPYPTGFNVAMSFDRPVFGATAQVAGGTNVRITMTAKDSNGQVLGSAESPLITQPGKFVQSVSLRTTQRIAKLEWRPSNPNSMCAVDNVQLVTSPDLTTAIKHTVTGGVLRLSWPTVPGTNYQLLSSSDLRNWSACGAPRLATGAELSADCPISGPTGSFFKVQVVNGGR